FEPAGPDRRETEQEVRPRRLRPGLLDRNEPDAPAAFGCEFGKPFAVDAVEQQDPVAVAQAQDIAQVVHLRFGRLDGGPLRNRCLAMEPLHALPLAHSRSMGETPASVKARTPAAP